MLFKKKNKTDNGEITEIEDTAEESVREDSETESVKDSDISVQEKNSEHAEFKEEDSDVSALLAASDEAAEDKELQREMKKQERQEKREEKKAERKTKKKKNQKKPEEVNIVKELLSLIIYIGIVIILCYVIITFVGQRTTVHGDSMEATLQSGDNLWIDKISYEFSDPKRFDIVVFPYQGSDVYYIKRIIGLPGETVLIDTDGNIYIDGEILNEDYGLERITPNMIGIAGTPIVLGKDEYFVLGDNRNNSRDSRWSDVGCVHKDDIIGKAVFRLSPLNKFGFID